MLKRIVITLAVSSGVLFMQNADAVWEYAHKPFSGKYVIYGGFLDEPRAPSPGDIRIAFDLTGAPAEEMFNAIGPDLEGQVCPERSIRVRQRDMLLCRYRPKDGYWCNFGFDLSTGLSIGGVIGGAACQN